MSAIRSTNILFTGHGGFACDIAEYCGGWCAAYLSFDDPDDRFLAEFGRYGVRLIDSASEADWTQAMLSTPIRLHVVKENRGVIRECVVSESGHMSGPMVLGGEIPLVVWCESDGREWRLMQSDGSTKRRLASSRLPLARPVACRTDSGAVWTACECSAEGKVRVHFTGSVAEPLEMAGRNPALASFGHAALLVHELHEEGQCHIYLNLISDDMLQYRLQMPSPHPLNFNPTLLISDAECLVVWEASAAWGADDRLGLVRELVSTRIPLNHLKGSFGPAVVGEVLPVPVVGFVDANVQNIVPRNPRLVSLPDGVGCVYRVFEPRGTKSFGWGTEMLLLRGDHWEGPCSLPTPVGFPDTSYGIAPSEQGLVAAMHCCEHMPLRTYSEIENDLPPRTTQRATDHKIEVRTINIPGVLSRKSPRYEVVEPACVGPETPVTEQGQSFNNPDGLQLLWGSLHNHTCYSKCMSAQDGTSRDSIIYQRDVLGCEVICITDHVEYMSGLEYRITMDVVEEAADSGAIVLYAVEWAKMPGHHVNFYCSERRVMDQLRGILLVEDRLAAVFRRIRCELPPDSVAAIRHFHGFMQGAQSVTAPDAADSFDPHLEWVMEAVQLRGDMMLAPPEGYPRFPVNFLDAGAKIGLVGGLDHTRPPYQPYHCCLTGVWVSEASARGVFEALKARRTLASMNGKLPLWIETDGACMGESAEARGHIQLHLRLPACDANWCVRVMKDGRWLDAMVEFREERSLAVYEDDAVSGDHWYLLRVEAAHPDSDNRIAAYTSPIWVTYTGGSVERWLRTS